MKLLSGLRELVYLRRASRALESLAESQATLARIETERWQRECGVVGKRGQIEFGELDLATLNERHALVESAMADGMSYDEALRFTETDNESNNGQK